MWVGHGMTEKRGNAPKLKNFAAPWKKEKKAYLLVLYRDQKKK